MRISDWSSDVCSSDLLRIGNQCADQRTQAVRSQDHRFLPAASTQQPVGKDMAALRISAQLRLVDRHDSQIAIHRHGFSREEKPERSEKRRVGKGCVRPCRLVGATVITKKTTYTYP